MYVPDSSIVPYLEALAVNSVVSRSHEVLFNMLRQHGPVFDDWMREHWETERSVAERILL